LSRRSKLWLLAIVALAAGHAIAASLLPRGFALTFVSDVTQLVLLLAGVIVLVPNILNNHGRVRWFWSFMTLGVGLWFAYQALWNYFEIWLHTDVPDLFLIDIILFLHLVPMMAAVALQPQHKADERTTRFGTLDFSLLLIWWIFLYLFAVIPWQYVSPDRAAYNQNLNALYLVEKIVLLGGLAISWVRSSSRSWRIIYAHWFGATLLYSLSSYLANWALGRNVYYSGSLYDIPLVASMAWVTGAGLVAFKLRPEQESVETRSRHRVWVARSGMVATSSLPLLAIWTLLQRGTLDEVRDFRLLLTLGTIMAMGVLVLLRQRLLDAELLSLLCASQDSIENLKRLQVQLVQSEKLAALGQLVGGAAHELNNPLTAILGYSDLIAATELTPQQRSLAEKIGHQVRRTKSLVGSLLSFARQMPGARTPIDLSSLAQTAIKLLQPQLRAHNVEVRGELAQGLPPIMGDSNQLLQTCIHIATNAIQALDEVGGGMLRISTRAEGRNVILEFSDNGPGAREPERVFDPFYTTKPVGQGSGLGLSFCYGVVQEHNGRIVCTNAPHGGAVFSIELPAISTASLPEVSAAKAGSQG
jgi:signal transduction histidine kinase